MNEQLRLIQALRLEISELTSAMDITKNNYDSIDKVIDTTFHNIQNMYAKLKATNDKIDDVKAKKILKYSLICGIVSSVATLVILKFHSNMNGYTDVLIALVESFTSGILVTVVPPMFLPLIDKFNMFLIKKCPDLKEIDDEIKNLETAIRISEINFIKMKKEKEALDSTIKVIGDKLSGKREELYILEEEYFNSLNLENVAFEDGREAMTGSVGIGKRKIRVP